MKMGFMLCTCLAFAALVAAAGAQSAYFPEDQATLLDQHNAYRTGVSPEASNMNRMEWDSELATLAQAWADKCFFYHPDTDVHTDYKTIGQNLYIQFPDYTGLNPPAVTTAVDSWYDEHRYYYYNYKACVTGKKCGHYTQVVWANTTKVGCGITFCPQVVKSDGETYEYVWLVACNYSPGGNYRGQSPYETGNHCSKCSDGKYCKNKLCSNCDPSTDAGCECTIECGNCGAKSASACTCHCKDGYYGVNCENYCENTHPYCGGNPGWPIHWCGRGYWFMELHCPLMCGQCTPGPRDASC